MSAAILISPSARRDISTAGNLLDRTRTLVRKRTGHASNSELSQQLITLIYTVKTTRSRIAIANDLAITPSELDTILEIASRRLGTDTSFADLFHSIRSQL